MKTKDLISFSDLAGECGVTQSAITKFVNRHSLLSYRLPHSPKGRALAPAQADLVRIYYAVRKQDMAIKDSRELVPA